MTDNTNAASIAAGLSESEREARFKSGWIDGTVLHIGKRKYDMRKVSKASGNRFRALLNSERVSTTVEFEDEWLTPTIYFQFYTSPVVIREKVYAK